MSNTFNPPFLLKNKHIQTLYSSLFRKSSPHNFEVQRFTLSDGDFVEAYWYNKQTFTHNKPIVILFHGLAGSYKSPYIGGTMKKLNEHGFESVLMHFRGCSGIMNKHANAYHSGKTDDPLEFINALKLQYPSSKLFGIGYSLGGNMLLKLLGELSHNSPLSGAISVSAPMLLDVCANAINKGFSRLYQKHLLKNLNEMLSKKYDSHNIESLIKLPRKDVKNLSTFWEFDEAYTAPIHGFKSAKDYYAKCSSKPFLKHIQTPTLVINSSDDPFMTPEILPTQNDVSDKVELEFYARGGHVGFIQGSIFKPEYWLEDRIISYFDLMT